MKRKQARKVTIVCTSNDDTARISDIQIEISIDPPFVDDASSNIRQVVNIFLAAMREMADSVDVVDTQ